MATSSGDNQTGKIVKWTVWIVVAALLVFGGWGMKETYSGMWGRFFMSIGWLLSGFLLLYSAHQNLKK